VYCTVSKWLKISTDFSLDQAAPSLQFLYVQAPLPNFKGDPSAGVKYTEVGWKIYDFQLISYFTWETVRDRPMIAVERKQVVRSESVSMTSGASLHYLVKCKCQEITKV